MGNPSEGVKNIGLENFVMFLRNFVGQKPFVKSF